MDGSLKYETLAKWLRERIETGQLGPGDRVYSENELCLMFSISRQTVRQAIGLLEREGLVIRRRGSGTYVARRDGRAWSGNRNIGVAMTYLDSYIFPAILRGIERVLSRNGYGMLLAMTHNQPDGESRALKSFSENRVAGLIAEPTKSGLPSPNLEAYRHIHAAGTPIVFMHARYPQLAQVPCVSLDDRLAGLTATRHLIAMGHRRIAGVFKSDDLQGHMRYLGYIEALAEAGLDSDSGNVLWFTTEDIPFINQDMDRVVRYLAGCTGLVCYNDHIAYPLCQQLRARGIAVPEGLSVVGIDNAELAAPGEMLITSIAHPMQRLGEAVAQAVLRLVRDPAADVGKVFEPYLVEGASVRHI